MSGGMSYIGSDCEAAGLAARQCCHCCRGRADIVMFARGVIYMRSVPVDWLSAAAEFASLSHHLLGQRIGTDSP